jgi:DNA-binding NtrC family response regulator
MSRNDFEALIGATAAPPIKDEARRPPVLVVDDDAALRESLAGVLETRYEVLLAASAKEGVSSVHEGVCAVILDVKMKGYDGFWACNEIRKKHPDMPVIFYSAYQDLKDPYAIINDHRPFGYITKDGDINKLLSAVETAVRLSQIILFSKTLIKSHKEGRQQST